MQGSSQVPHPASQSRYPSAIAYASIQPQQQQQPQTHQQQQQQQQQHMPASSLQSYTDYNQQAQDVYSTLSQPFTFNTAPVPTKRSATSGKHPFQSNGQATSNLSSTQPQVNKQDLPPVAPSDSASGGPDSAFAESFYKAEGPGLNHFHTVLSREFNVPDDASPAGAAAGTSPSHPNDPSSIMSEAGFSPAGSDVALPAHMERDLVALADLIPTQQTLFGLYWCFVHVQWPIGKHAVMDGIGNANGLDGTHAACTITL